MDKTNSITYRLNNILLHVIFPQFVGAFTVELMDIISQNLENINAALDTDFWNGGQLFLGAIDENFKAATQLSDEEISEVLSIRLGKWSFVDSVVIENGKKVKALKETPLEIFTAVWKEIGKSVAVNGIVGEKSYQADMIYKPQLGLFVETFNDGVIRHSFWSRHSKSIMSKVISPKNPSGAKESMYIRKDNTNQISGEFEAEINGKIVYALEFKGTRNLEKN